MTSTGNSRRAAVNDQRSSANIGARSRPPSSRLGAQGRPESREDVFPQDSASNAPHRRTTFDAQRTNGSTRITTERQTERIRFTTRDNVRVQTRSPGKENSGDGAGEREHVVEPPRVGSRATERLPTNTSKRKETLRELEIKIRELLVRYKADKLSSQPYGIPKSL